jgi:hypothetical protein
MSKFLPFLPVFRGGQSRFQPVYVGDIARAVELISRKDPAIEKHVAGKFLEAGGPESLFTKFWYCVVISYNCFFISFHVPGAHGTRAEIQSSLPPYPVYSI